MSTIIIRLQNLPLSAKAADIREFFGDLKIPKGSVNIVGGPMGDAFIGFASDEDARLAMLLEGRLLHNAKIRLMLSSRREMDQVIANAQSQAVKPSGAPPEAPDQQHDVVVPAASKLQTQYSTMTMPKNEVVSTSATNIASTSLSAFPFGQPLQPTFQQTLPPPQSASIGGPPQPSYSSFSGGDSWKTPQQSFPSLTTHQISQSVQPPPQIAQQPTLPPVFPGPIGNDIHGPPPPQPHQVPHYQQLPQQPPGFPPPLGLPPGPNGGQQKSTTGFQQPLPNFGRPSSGNNSGDNFFNQPVLQPAVGAGIPTFFGPGPQRFPPPHFGQTYAAPAPPGQQQKPQFFGGPTGGGHFRQPGQQHKQQQQQFGQRAPNQSHFGNQQSNFASAQHRQPRQEGASGGNYRAGKFGQQTQQQQQPFAAQTHQKTFYSVGSGDGGGGGAVKRRRSRTPDDTTNKRFNAAQPRFAPGRQGSANSNQQSRICIQLSNVPFKATFDEVQDYLSASKVKGVKATRVYLPDRNFSDRWIVEFDNENEAKTLIRSRGMINGRTIRVERIDPRRADEQYAIQEPDEADGDNRGGGRSRRDESRKEGGTRRENIKRERTQNRDRSRSKERTEKSATIPERQHQPQQQEDRPASQETSSIWERGRRPSSRIEENRDVNGGEWSLREEAQLPPASSPPKETPTNEMATTDSRPSSKSVSSHHPVPLSEAFGAFSFPATQTNAVYNAKSGTTVQLGAKDGIKPIPLRSFDAAPPQFFPCHPNSAGTGPFHRPPPLFNIASSNNNQRSAAPNGDDNGQKIGNVSAAAGGHFQPNVASQWPVQSANADALPSPHFRHSAKTSSPPQHKPSNAGTGANAIPVSGQWPFSGTQQHRDDNTADSSAAKSPSSSTSHFSHENAAPNTSRTKLVVQENLSEVDNDQRSDVHLRTDFDGRQRDDNNTAGQESRHLAKSTFFGPSPAATDNIGPFSAPFPIKSEAEHAAESHQPPPDPRPPQTQRMMEFSPQRRAFDSTPITLSCNEFSPQEVELRPHLLFLEHYRQDPNANTCIRLENVPKMVFVEQLSEFLDVTIESPCQNIARMHNGVLYINLENELFASKAASKNCLFLYGNQIGITQLRKAEMADAIRQNMIIIRELYRVTVVARGFPLMVQPIEVVKLFERFNVNRDGVEKCAVKATDTISTYLLTFPSVQDCRNAIRELNGTITSGGTRIQVFQPEGLGI